MTNGAVARRNAGPCAVCMHTAPHRLEPPTLSLKEIEAENIRCDECPDGVCTHRD